MKVLLCEFTGFCLQLVEREDYEAIWYSVGRRENPVIELFWRDRHVTSDQEQIVNRGRLYCQKN